MRILKQSRKHPLLSSQKLISIVLLQVPWDPHTSEGPPKAAKHEGISGAVIGKQQRDVTRKKQE